MDTDPGHENNSADETRTPVSTPSARAWEPFREFIEAELAKKGRNAMAIWRDLVDGHGFTEKYASAKRFPMTPTRWLWKLEPADTSSYAVTWKAIRTAADLAAGRSTDSPAHPVSRSHRRQHPSGRSRTCSLRVGSMSAVLATRLRQAQAEPMAPIDLISCLISDELTRRADRLLECRQTEARGASFLGPGGTGKSHLAQAIGQACDSTRLQSVYRETHIQLDELAEAVGDGTRKEYMEMDWGTVPLLIIDDFDMRKLPLRALRIGWKLTCAATSALGRCLDPIVLLRTGASCSAMWLR